jgi:hypothetical protein
MKKSIPPKVKITLPFIILRARKVITEFASRQLMANARISSSAASYSTSRQGSAMFYSTPTRLFRMTTRLRSNW